MEVKDRVRVGERKWEREFGCRVGKEEGIEGWKK